METKTESLLSIDDEEFGSIGRTQQSMYILYWIRWETQPEYVKVGYGNLQRPKSSSYSTPFGCDGVVTVYIPEQLYTKNETYQIEQQLHPFLRETKGIPRGNNGGEEVYKMSSEQACFYIEEFIRTNRHRYYQTYTSTISNYKRVCKINPKQYSIIESIELNDVKHKCELCNRKCNSTIYKCQIVNREDCDDTIEIFVGTTCMQKFYSNISLKSILKNEFHKKNCFSPLDIINQCINKSYKNKVVNNIKYGEEKEGEIPVYFNTMQHQYCKSEHQRMILLAICNYIFSIKQTFKVEIDNSFISKYNIDDNIYTIYGLLKDIAYFQLGDILDNGELFFSLEFVHPDYNINKVKKKIANLNNKRCLRTVQGEALNCRFCIEHCRQKLQQAPETKEQVLIEDHLRANVDATHKGVDESQTRCLVSTSPFISGSPGTGKSQIITHAIQHNPYEEFLIITPTYSTLNGLYNRFSKYPNVHAMVIQSIHPPYQNLDVVPTVIFIDEYGMFSIFDWVKVIKLCNQFENQPIIKIFGDPYQLPPIGFTEETKPIARMILLGSDKLAPKPYRAKCTKTKKLYEELNNTKCNLNLNWLNQNLTVETYNDRTIISNSRAGFCFLASTNRTVDDINMKIYNYIKSTECPRCSRGIQIGEQYFCFECISKFKFIMTDNVSKKKNALNIEQEVVDRIKGKKVFYNGENIQLKSSLKKGYLNITSLGQDGKADVGKPVIELLPEKLRFLKLKLSNAQTIHKSQGQSLSKVFIVLDRNRIESSALYTAITRGSSAQEIKLCYKVDPNTVRVIRNDFDDTTENDTVDESKSETVDYDTESQSETSIDEEEDVEANPHQTQILWGKYEGKPHSYLLTPSREIRDYANWISGKKLSRKPFRPLGKAQEFTVSYLKTYLK
jgi:hypothetical protein